MTDPRTHYQLPEGMPACAARASEHLTDLSKEVSCQRCRMYLAVFSDKPLDTPTKVMVR